MPSCTDKSKTDFFSHLLFLLQPVAPSELELDAIRSTNAALPINSARPKLGCRPLRYYAELVAFAARRLRKRKIRASKLLHDAFEPFADYPPKIPIGTFLKVFRAAMSTDIACFSCLSPSFSWHKRCARTNKAGGRPLDIFFSDLGS